jgi:hypothetical protein
MGRQTDTDEVGEVAVLPDHHSTSASDHVVLLESGDKHSVPTHMNLGEALDDLYAF